MNGGLGITSQGSYQGTPSGVPEETLNRSGFSRETRDYAC
jgi:hypothetical protein